MADDLSVLEHSEYDIVTLLTCEGYSIAKDTYPYRRVVRGDIGGGRCGVIALHQ